MTMPTIDDDTPQLDYDQFEFYVGMAGDYFQSLESSYANTPWVTAAEKAAITSGLAWLTRATLNPAEYYAAYQNNGWVGLADQAIESGITNFFVSESAAWATTGALALGLSGGAAFMIGLGAGVAVGAGTAFALDWATGGSLVGSLSGLLDHLQEYDSDNPGGTILPDGSLLLPEIVVTGYGDFDILSEARDLINDLNLAVMYFNQVYNQFGIELDLNDMLSNDYFDWIESFEQGLDEALGDPNASIGDQEIGLGVSIAIAQNIQQLANLYQQHPQAFDAIKPDFGANIMAAAQSADGFLQAVMDRISPLVLDLDGDGIETTSILDGHAQFDFGNGHEIAHGWIAPDDGFLALDKNSNGKIDDITELFGSKDRDGFTILSEYDDNSDGIINANDYIYSQLFVWQDLNGDGKSDESELQSLADRGVQSINLAPVLQDVADNKNWIPLSSSITLSDGSEGEIADVYLSHVRTYADDSIDVVSDSYVVAGGAKADCLEGNEKDQIFVGGRGDDTYVYARGDGNDTIIEPSLNGYADKLVFTDINPDGVSLVRDDDNFALVIAETSEGAGDGGSVLIKYTLDDNYGSGIDTIVFADGTTWFRNDLRVQLLAQAATDGNDTITGFNVADTITGGLGDDTLTGGAGDDLFVFESGFGSDVVTDFAIGQDTIQFTDVFTDFDDMIAHAEQVGSNVVITDDNLDVLTLPNVSLAGLDHSDFVIA